MAWILANRYENEYNRWCSMKNESFDIFSSQKKFLNTEVLESEFHSTPTLTQGFRYPKSDHVYEFETEYSACEFGNVMHSSQGFLVSQNVVDLIEKLEPGVHQYFPVKIFLKDNVELRIRYYLLNICEVIQAMIYDKSEVRVDYWDPINSNPRKYNTRMVTATFAIEFGLKAGELGRIYVDREKIKNRSLWAEVGFDKICCSEEFLQKMNEIGGLGTWQRIAKLEEASRAD